MLLTNVLIAILSYLLKTLVAVWVDTYLDAPFPMYLILYHECN